MELLLLIKPEAPILTIKALLSVLNDIGIITLPNGKHFAIAVYVSDSSEKSDVNEKIIAEICKSVWDYLVKDGK